MKFKKKGIGAMGNSLVIGIVIFILLITIGLTVINGFQTNNCQYSYSEATGLCLNSTGGTGGTITYSTAFNATKSGILGLDKMSSFTTVIALAGIAVIVIGMIMGLQYMRGR